MKRELQCSLVLSGEGDNPADWWPCETYIREVVRPFDGIDGIAVQYAEMTPEDSEYDSELWRDANDLHSCNVSGIAPLRVILHALCDAGMVFEDCETMGTLGGPLTPWGGIVPDFPFTNESRLCVVSARITPFVPDADGDPKPLTEASWGRVRAFLRNGNWY